MTVDRTSQAAGKKENSISEESILKVSKEIVIKFIEMGRITPTTFDETFRTVHTTITDTVKKGK